MYLYIYGIYIYKHTISQVIILKSHQHGKLENPPIFGSIRCYGKIQPQDLSLGPTRPNHPPQFPTWNVPLHLESQRQLFSACLFAALAFHQMAGAGTQKARALTVQNDWWFKKKLWLPQKVPPLPCFVRNFYRFKIHNYPTTQRNFQIPNPRGLPGLLTNLL